MVKSLSIFRFILILQHTIALRVRSAIFDKIWPKIEKNGPEGSLQDCKSHVAFKIVHLAYDFY